MELGRRNSFSIFFHHFTEHIKVLLRGGVSRYAAYIFNPFKIMLLDNMANQLFHRPPVIIYNIVAPFNWVVNGYHRNFGRLR